MRIQLLVSDWLPQQLQYYREKLNLDDNLILQKGAVHASTATDPYPSSLPGLTILHIWFL